MSEAEVKARGLTPREEEIMGLVADGLMDREIATALGISAQTIKNHLTKIYTRLSARNRAHAVFIMFCSSGSTSVAASTQQNKTQEIPLLTLSEAATFLHIHQNTVRNLSDAGFLKPYRLGLRRDRCFRADDLRQFLLRHTG